MTAELRWILAGLGVLLLAGIWWWGTRRSRQAPGNPALHKTTVAGTAASMRASEYTEDTIDTHEAHEAQETGEAYDTHEIHEIHETPRPMRPMRAAWRTRTQPSRRLRADGAYRRSNP